ncbi:MAG: family transcriptional regulator, cyclic receptor protein [Hyphomicrobiales bacterium]|jgi:CRP-like cAMP-binding protein|nr:family transcriptional regulator, cyclic receptor protein [Hyphomicrobiales bacterium]
MSARPTSPKATFDKQAIFRAHPLFGQLGADAISRLASYAHSKSAAAGTTIFERGDPGNSLFAVCSGTVKISNRSTEGKDAVFNLIKAGEIFGEIAMLDGHPRTADALAITDCDLLVIDRRDFVPMVTQSPEIALKLIEILCARLRHTSEQVEDLMFLDLPSRLAKTLLSLAASPKAAQDRKISITQREIGQIIGMSRESTNKQLRIWEEKKWVRLNRGGVAVLDPDSLEEIAAAERDQP